MDWKLKSIDQFSQYEIGVLSRLNEGSTTSASTFYKGVPCKLFVNYDESNGYGKIQHLGQSVYCHRLVASIYYDFDLQSDLHICHHCDVRNCWEPSHLFPGTRSDNMKDAFIKGRMKNTWEQRKSAKTHCPKGHPYFGTNLIITKLGERKCRECQNQYVRNWMLKKKGVTTNA